MEQFTQVCGPRFYAGKGAAKQRRDGRRADKKARPRDAKVREAAKKRKRAAYQSVGYSKGKNCVVDGGSE